MIDILDDSYESDITDEEHEQLILRSEHAIAPQFSPAAQAIIGGYMKDQYGRISTYARHNLANALRAAAEIVAPLSYEDVWTDGRLLQYEKDDPVRDKLLAIADELEPQ